MKTYKLKHDFDRDWDTEDFFICAEGLNALVNLPKDITTLEVTFYDRDPKDQDALHLELTEDLNRRTNTLIDGVPVEIDTRLYDVLLRNFDRPKVWVVFHYYG